MAAKRFLSLFKSSNKREKENNDPLLNDYQYHISNGQRRSSADKSSKRRSCATEVNNDDDDGSEVTLTATEASRQQNFNKKMPPNPYLIITEPKRNHGPRSCPGGGGGQHFFDFDSLDNDEISGVNGGILDRSLEARSEFISTQPHRRSNRRRVIPLDDKTSSTQSAHPPFTEIGNGNGHIGQQRDSNFVTSSRYKNIPWTSADFNNWGMEGGLGGKQQLIIRLREQQKEINELAMAYRSERTRRKEIQRDLRKEQENKERLMMETFRLQSIIGVLLHQQQSKTTGNSNMQNGVDLNTLIGASGIMQQNNLYSSWTGNTPSSSSATAAPSVNQQSLHHPSNVIPNSWTPCRTAASLDFFGFQQQLPPLPPPVALFGNRGGPGECLAAPIHSSSSLTSQQIKQQKLNHHQQDSDDEIKVFRNAQHNTDSFSGSSRLTTGDLTSLERDKQDLTSDLKFCDSPESPEVERGGGNTTLHGLSFSADDCQHLFGQRNRGGKDERDISIPTLFPDNELPLRDDGYSTSETNMSASGIANSECTETILGGGNISSSLLNNGNANLSKFRRYSKSTGQLASSF